MSAFARTNLPPFAFAVSEGLSAPQKYIHSGYLYDTVGSKLFAALANRPEYGTALAEERTLRRHAEELSQITGADVPRYDLSRRHLSEESPYEVKPCETPYRDWLDAAAERLSCDNAQGKPALFTLPGGCFGNLDSRSRRSFLDDLRLILRPGDYLLFACDLLNSVERMLAAHDDAAGIAAAFNKNLLTRINRELGGHFDVRRFAYRAKWDAFLRRVEMHIVALEEQETYIGALGQRFHFQTGESIHTGSFYKFGELELEELAGQAGFVSLKTWIDIESSFAEALWTV